MKCTSLPLHRRDFIVELGAAATLSAWPRVAEAQVGRMARVGYLGLRGQTDPIERARLGWFRQNLETLGWTDGRNLRLEARWPAENVDRIRALAKELADLRPDVIVVAGGAAAKAVQDQTKTIPIVLAGGGDPVENGLVRNIARPEGNITGFGFNVPSFGSKWLELLKEAAPAVTRIAVVFNPDVAASGPTYLASIEMAAERHGIEVVRCPVHSIAELESAIEAFASKSNGGLVELPPPLLGDQRQSLYRLALKHRLPGIYGQRAHIAEGGLMSYGPDTAEVMRSVASYVDRILRGAKVSDLPVQFPTKFELVINLKAANAIGLTIPESFLLRADEVIE